MIDPKTLYIIRNADTDSILLKTLSIQITLNLIESNIAEGVEFIFSGKKYRIKSIVFNQLRTAVIIENESIDYETIIYVNEIE